MNKVYKQFEQKLSESETSWFVEFINKWRNHILRLLFYKILISVKKNVIKNM